MKRLWLLPLALCAGLVGITRAGSEQESPSLPDPKIVILHTNDLHGQVYSWRNRGGMAALAATLKRVRAEEEAKGARVFIVDCGDFFQGTPEGDLTEGRLVIDTFNEIGYDALCVGNHEFDFGSKVTERLARRARFPFLGANVRTEEGKLPDYLHERVVFPEDRIQFIGLVPSDMPTLVTVKALRGLEFLLEEKVLDRLLPKSRFRTVLLTHIGHEKELELARKYDVSAVIGGHSHKRMQEMVGSTLYSQAGSRGTLVGVVEIGEKTTGRFVKVSPKNGEDPQVQQIIDLYTPEIDLIMNEEIGVLETACARMGKGTSLLGNWLCDLMREATGADVALHNRTGIRATLAPGSVRLRDLYKVSPFRNTLVTMKLQGKELVDLLTRAMSHDRLFLEMSGVRYTMRNGAVEDVHVGDDPVDPQRLYVVVTNSFLAAGGDGHEIFNRGRERIDTLKDLLDVHKKWVRKNSPVKLTFRERVHFDSP